MTPTCDIYDLSKDRRKPDPEVALIQALIEGMKLLDIEQSERVVAYAQKLHESKHGKKKVCREPYTRGGPDDR